MVALWWSKGCRKGGLRATTDSHNAGQESCQLFDKAGQRNRTPVYWCLIPLPLCDALLFAGLIPALGGRVKLHQFAQWLVLVAIVGDSLEGSRGKNAGL